MDILKTKKNATEIESLLRCTMTELVTCKVRFSQLFFEYPK